MLVTNYFIRSNKKHIKFKTTVKNNYKFIKFNNQIKNVKLDKNLQGEVIFDIHIKDLPIGNNYFYSNDGEEWKRAKISKELINLNFDEQSFRDSKFTWGPANRHKDPETTAFIAMQLAKFCTWDNSVKHSMSVVYAYRSLELENMDLIIDAKEILLECLSNNAELAHSNSIRSDRDHLYFSQLYVLQILNLYLGLEKDFVNIWTMINSRLQPVIERKVLRTSLYNINKSFMLAGLYFYKKGDLASVKNYADLSLELFKKAVYKFDDNFDIIHLKEMDVQLKDVTYIQALKRIKKDQKILDKSVQYHFKCNTIDQLVEIISDSAFRTKGTVNSTLKKSFQELTFCSAPAIFELENNSNTFNKKLNHLKQYLKKDSYLADILRDISFRLEEIDDNQAALKLINAAHELRPNGPVIKDRLLKLKKKTHL